MTNSFHVGKSELILLDEDGQSGEIQSLGFRSRSLDRMLDYLGVLRTMSTLRLWLVGPLGPTKNGSQIWPSCDPWSEDSAGM